MQIARDPDPLRHLDSLLDVGAGGGKGRNMPGPEGSCFDKIISTKYLESEFYSKP